jgi:nitroreductase
MRLTMDSIRARHSTRTYDGQPLTPDEERGIRASFAEAAPGPFGSSPRFMLASRDEVEDGAASSDIVARGMDGRGEDAGSTDGRVRIGTYGLIVGPRAFVAGVIRRAPFACVDFGYCLEGVILRATELGLDTCWVGGVFGRGAIARALAASRDEFVPATTPVGHAAGKPSIQEMASRIDSRPHTRLDFGQLFFEAGKDGSWTALASPGEWKDVLEAVRIGPSARNMQPWRLVLDRRSGQALHLVMQENRFYNNVLGATKLQELDMGIAMRHVEVAAAELGIRGSWSRLGSCPVAAGSPRRYFSTFSREN